MKDKFNTSDRKVFEMTDANASEVRAEIGKELDRQNDLFPAGKIHDEIIVIGDLNSEAIEAIKKQLEVKRGTWKSNREPILQNIPRNDESLVRFHRVGGTLPTDDMKAFVKGQIDFEKRLAYNAAGDLIGILPTDEIQSVPRTERSADGFALAKLNLLKRFNEMNLLENERGSTPHRLPYAKESLTLEIKDNIDGTIVVYYDGDEVEAKDVSIINSFLEKTRGYDSRK